MANEINKITVGSTTYTLQDERVDSLGSVYAPIGSGVYLVKGNTSGTVGAWTGSSDYISSYYDGLVVAYDIGIEGASTTTLNINGLGAKTVYLRGTTKLTTHYAVGTIILLTYSADNGCWYKADYDANTNTQIRIYRQTSGYNADYPIIVSRTATSSIGTAGTNSSYSAVYGVIGQNGTYTPTINPHTGEGKFKTVTATTFNGDLSGNATTATTADNATKLGGQVASYYATASSIPTKTSQLTNDSGFKTTDNNTTYSLSKSGSTITLTGSDGSTTSVTDSNSTYTVNNGTLTIQKNGTSVGTFTANQSGNTTANITVPTTASEVGALPISGGTIAGTSGDTPLYIKSAHTTASYEGFKRADGTTLGYFGYSSTDNPVVYLNNGGAKTIYHTGNLPTIPTVNNGTLTITENGISKGTFTANQSGNTTIALTNTTYSNATTSTAGLMSAADKTKLDGISNGSGGGISGTWTSGTSGTVKLPSAGTYQVRYGNGYTSVLWWNGTSTATSPLIRINAAGTCYRFYAALSGTLTLKTGTLTTTTETDSTATIYYRRIGD